MSGLFDRLQDEIEARNQSDGLSPIDLLDMPESLASVINLIVRRNGLKLEDIAAFLGQPVDATKDILDELVAKKLVRRVQVKNQIWYKANFGRKADKTDRSGIWSMLGDIMGDNSPVS